MTKPNTIFIKKELPSFNELIALLIEDIKNTREGNNAQLNCGNLTNFVINRTAYYLGLKEFDSSKASTEPSTSSTKTYITTDKVTIKTENMLPGESINVVTASAERTKDGLYSNLPFEEKLLEIDLEKQTSISEINLESMIIAKKPVNSPEELNQRLKNLAKADGKIIFGHVGMARINNSSGHVLAFVANEDEVIYIDGQLYNGITKKGEPAFSDFRKALRSDGKRAHEFEGESKKTAQPFQLRCFYLVHGGVKIKPALVPTLETTPSATASVKDASAINNNNSATIFFDYVLNEHTIVEDLKNLSGYTKAVTIKHGVKEEVVKAIPETVTEIFLPNGVTLEFIKAIPAHIKKFKFSYPIPSELVHKFCSMHESTHNIIEERKKSSYNLILVNKPSPSQTLYSTSNADKENGKKGKVIWTSNPIPEVHQFFSAKEPQEKIMEKIQKLDKNVTQISLHDFSLENSSKLQLLINSLPNTINVIRFVECEFTADILKSLPESIKGINFTTCQLTVDNIKLIPKNVNGINFTACKITVDIIKAIQPDVIRLIFGNIVLSNEIMKSIPSTVKTLDLAVNVNFNTLREIPETIELIHLPKNATTLCSAILQDFFEACKTSGRDVSSSTSPFDSVINLKITKSTNTHKLNANPVLDAQPFSKESHAPVNSDENTNENKKQKPNEDSTTENYQQKFSELEQKMNEYQKRFESQDKIIDTLNQKITQLESSREILIEFLKNQVEPTRKILIELMTIQDNNFQAIDKLSILFPGNSLNNSNPGVNNNTFNNPSLLFKPVQNGNINNRAPSNQTPSPLNVQRK